MVLALPRVIPEKSAGLMCRPPQTGAFLNFTVEEAAERSHLVIPVAAAIQVYTGFLAPGVCRSIARGGP